jgi:hypothetical protein
MKISPTLCGAALSMLTFVVPPQLVSAKSSSTVAKAAPARSWVTLQASTERTRIQRASDQSATQRDPIHTIAARICDSPEGQRFDFTVYPGGQQRAAYTWSAARMFIQALGSLWLKPGQNQNYEAAVADEMGSLSQGNTSGGAPDEHAQSHFRSACGV